eukprot:m.484628 g.484628  ORF g.484628 m.484628 type:complete len:55 (-) comp23464_c0_seq1:364-528(-)
MNAEDWGVGVVHVFRVYINHFFKQFDLWSFWTLPDLFSLNRFGPYLLIACFCCL